MKLKETWDSIMFPTNIKIGRRSGRETYFSWSLHLHT